MRSYEKLKERFVYGCRMRQDVDYADKASVRKYNRGMDICRKVMKQIDTDYPDKLDDFSGFLESPETEIRYMCAFCLAEIAHLSQEQEQRTLEKVAEYFDTQFSLLTMPRWLEEYKNRRKK